MDEAYLRAMFADEIQLASLLHYHQVKMPPILHVHATLYQNNGAPGAWTSGFPVPRWRRDWLASGPLVGHHGLSLEQNEVAGTVTVRSRDGAHSTCERYDDHPEPQLAVHAAIVRTVIPYLKAQRAALPAQAA